MPEVQTLTIERQPDRRSQFGPTRKVYFITCELCKFDFEREKVEDARWFAQMHNEEMHSNALDIVDLTVAPTQ